MALKDWKKLKDNVIDFLWEKKGESSYYGNYEIWVYKERVNDEIKWIFRFREIGGGSYTKQFKNKSQALSFAKAYMRKH